MATYDISKHCYLCENKDFDVMRGMHCGLTGKKPFFENTCPDIDFNIAYEEKIKEVNIELDRVNRSKGLSLGNFYVYSVLSLVVILSGVFLGLFIFERGVISTVPLIIIGAGGAILPMAFGPLNNYRSGLKIATNKKTEMDEILALYGIDYDAEVIVDKDLHGNEEYEVNLSWRRL